MILLAGLPASSSCGTASRPPGANARRDGVLREPGATVPQAILMGTYAVVAAGLYAVALVGGARLVRLVTELDATRDWPPRWSARNASRSPATCRPDRPEPVGDLAEGRPGAAAVRQGRRRSPCRGREPDRRGPRRAAGRTRESGPCPARRPPARAHPRTHRPEPARQPAARATAWSSSSCAGLEFLSGRPEWLCAMPNQIAIGLVDRAFTRTGRSPVADTVNDAQPSPCAAKSAPAGCPRQDARSAVRRRNRQPAPAPRGAGAPPAP